jgi:hypothetical protein
MATAFECKTACQSGEIDCTGTALRTCMVTAMPVE